MTTGPEERPAVVRELLLTGSPAELTLPDVCARCGETAPKRLYWERVIHYHDSESSTVGVVGMRAPFCGACLERHEREVLRMPAWKQALQVFRTSTIVPAVLSAAAAVFFGWKLTPKPLPAEWLDYAAPGGLACFFGLIALLCLRAAWTDTRHYRVPPLTAVTGAFTYGADEAELFEGERYRYTLVNDVFYEALLAANRNRLWQPGGERARRASWKRHALFVVVAAVIAVAFLWDWIKPWVRVEW